MAAEEGITYKDVASWNTDDVVDWIKGLSDSLSCYTGQFLAHCICGSDLLKMTKDQLQYLKITQIGHQELLLEAIQQLTALENGRVRNLTITLASALSKKSSQLLSALDPTSSKQHCVSSEEAQAEMFLSHIDAAAGVMSAAKLLIHWLDHNPSSLIEDYDTFRNEVLMNALDFVAILQNSYDSSQMTESCRKLIKLTSVMMLPQYQAVDEYVHLVPVTISPRINSGLGLSIERTRQGNLLISKVNEGSPALECGLIHVGTEIVQINQQNVVGWELAKVVDAMKASGHQITLVLKMGPHHYQNGTKQEVVEKSGSEVESEVDENVLSRDPSRDSSLQPTNPSKDDEVYESPQTPESFEGDTDFSGMQPLDLKKQTAICPISDDGMVCGRHGSIDDTCEEIDDGEGSTNARKFDISFEERLEHNTSGDGRLIKRIAEVEHRKLPEDAYRTQVIGGVIVRVPIKPKENMEKSAVVKKPKPKQKASHVKKPAYTEDDSDSHTGQHGKAVFVDAGEVSIGGQVAKQVTVHSVVNSDSKEDLAAIPSKKNPALLVPCFQLKDTQIEGWMNKLGGSGLTPKNWRRRWFVLKDRKLYYYKTSFDISALGIVDLAGYNIDSALEIKKKNVFKASRSNARTYYFQTDTSEEMSRWMQVLNEATHHHGDGDFPTSASIEASDDEL